MIYRIGIRMLLGFASAGIFHYAYTVERVYAASDAASAENSARLENGRVSVNFDLTRGVYDLLDAASGQIVVKEAYAEVAEWKTKDNAYTRTAKSGDVSDELGKGQSLTIECAAAGKPLLLLEFRLYENKPFIVLRGGWKNTSAESLRVKDFRPMTGGTVFADGKWSDVRTLTSNSACVDPHVHRSPYASSSNNLLLTLKRDDKRCSLVLGALKTADFTKWTHTLPEGFTNLREAQLHGAFPGCRLAAYMDCGNDSPRPTRPGPELTLIQGSSYRFNPYHFTSLFSGRPESGLIASVIYHDRTVEFKAAKVDPRKRYFLGFSWWDGDANGRLGSVAAVDKNGKSYSLVEKLKLPSGPGKQGLPREYALAVPRETYADGVLSLRFSNASAATNIVVSEVWLWESDVDTKIPQEWSQGRAISQTPPSESLKLPMVAILEATDPVGKLIEPGETYLPEDSFYIDFLTADPFEALESYARQLRTATGAKPNPYDFPTVCAWYAGVWKTPGAGNHPENSKYKINTTPGMVEEAAEIEKCGFLNYSRAAVRLVPDNYTPDNPQGWWDDKHWQMHGHYVAPYETSEKYGRGVHDKGCLCFSYFQSINTSEDFRKSHVDWLCGKDVKRTLDYTLPEVKEHLRKVFAAMRGSIDGLMFDYADELWSEEAVQGGFADPHATSTAYYRTLYRSAKEGLGPNSWVHERNLFQPNNDLTLGFIDLQRTTNDTDKITPELVSRSGLRWYKNRVVINYDMDSKELNDGWKVDGWTGSDTDGRRMLLTMAHVAASRLLLANSFRNMSKETLHDLSRTFPYPTEPKSSRPVDAFVCEGFPRIYDFAVTPRWHQLTLYNNTLPTREETFNVPLAGEQVSGALGLDPAKEYYFYDFWNNRFAGRLKGSAALSQKLRPSEARMLAVHEAEPNPQFLATDRHLMQGYLDLAKYPVWNDSTKTLSGTSRVVAGEPYRVFLATNGVWPLFASTKGAKAKVEMLDAANGLAALTLESSENAAIEWTVSANPPPETALPVLTPRPTAVPLALGGTWKFLPSAPAEFEKAAAHDDWADIQVPGEWVMQGFTVQPNTSAAYFRSFTLPVKPAKQRFKLRFSAVYSLCRVWLNGVEIGGHEGGFVPFEFDVTESLKTGTNTLAVSVQSESMLDKLSCGSQYACHPLGGISRKVQLFSVPEVHVSDLKIETTFDKNYRDATLTARLAFCNQSDRVSSGSATLTVVPIANSAKVDTVPVMVKWSDLAAGETQNEAVTIAVKNPEKWDNEHPHLYKLAVAAKDSLGNEEAIEQTFGFRQIEVRGNQVFINGTPIKIHGACRHEVHPLLGRALNAEFWKKDAAIFREGNCNFIRTSHYPPAEEFLDECDQLGLFVELEAPLCWVGQGASNYFKGAPTEEPALQRLVQANLETVEGYPNHPSVIMRSLANESAWSPLFAKVHQAVRKADATRPCTFHDQCWGDANNNGSTQMEIAVIHYPGLEGPALCAAQTRPVHFGEYCHLESYNRREMATDPGLRDLWGQGLDLMWGKMRAATGCFGGSIWAAIDDTFFLPNGDTVGYGAWGPIDGWRRPKPEFWNMKKAYSPVRIVATCVPVPSAGQPIRLEVENRHDFTDLGELRFEWKLGERSGTVTVFAAPGAKGVLEIPLVAENLAGKLLEVRAVSPRGFVEDVWQVALGVDPRVAPPAPLNKPGAIKLVKTDNTFIIRGAEFEVSVDAATGKMKATGKNGKSSLLSGPELLLLPMNDDFYGGMQLLGKEKEIPIFTDTCRDWKATSVTAKETAAGVDVSIEGSYSEAKGTYTLLFGNEGAMSVHYAFAVTEQGKCNPRQIGVVFGLSAECQTLSWRRKAFWSSYPDDHIGRPQGTAAAFEKGVPPSGVAGPRVEPTWSWSRDGNKHGSNDFRSTKLNVIEASLLSDAGNGLRALSNGSQHVRCWVDGDCSRLLVAEYANEGLPLCFSEYATTPRPLQAGAKVEGTIRLEIR